MKRIIFSSLFLKDGKFHLCATFTDTEKKQIFYKERAISDNLALRWLKTDKKLTGQVITVKDNQ